MASRIDNHTFVPVRFWSEANKGFYKNYRTWLKDGGYGESALAQYSVAMRLAVSVLDKEYWQIDLVDDIVKVQSMMAERYASQATQQAYNQGLRKLVEYLSQIQGRPKPPKPINWDYFFNGLPDWLCNSLRAYIRYSQRSWLPEQTTQLSASLLGRLTTFLRWTQAQRPLTALTNLTPDRWFAFVDARLADDIAVVTINGDLATLIGFLLFMQDGGTPICTRLLKVPRLKQPPAAPKDVAPQRLRVLLDEIVKECQREHKGVRRMGLMDRAWFLLMLHCGLRVGEVRRLRQSDIDLEDKRLRIEQSKGLKDRIVYLSAETKVAIEAYLPLLGVADSDHLFIYRHLPLSVTYCAQRLRTYGKRCGVTVTPHQLRHSCATLLLNAGAPVLTVQRLLGHKNIDTTLGYARLYNRTVAQDYYRAMQQVEQRLTIAEPTSNHSASPTSDLLTLVNQLEATKMTAEQQATIQQLRATISAMATSSASENAVVDTKIATS